MSVIELRAKRLTLHAVDEPEARRIRDRAPGREDTWAADYPFEGDVAAVGGFLRATEQRGEQRPFGYYQVARSSDRVAIGGVGFKGAPRDGRVEVGYGLAPSARGHGYAAEALAALLTVAADQGVTTVIADTTEDNVASQRTLARTGFVLVGVDGELQHYALRAV